MTMIKKIKPIEAGSLVAVQNCVGLFSVIRRISPNYYLVSFKGKETEFHRNQIGIPVRRAGLDSPSRTATATETPKPETTRTGGWVIFGLKYSESAFQSDHFGALDASPILPSGGSGRDCCRDAENDFPA